MGWFSRTLIAKTEAETTSLDALVKPGSGRAGINIELVQGVLHVNLLQGIELRNYSMPSQILGERFARFFRNFWG
jgi:hypothetical protein